MVCDPGLRTHLHRVPGTAYRGRVAEIQGVQVIDAHAVKQGCGKDIHPFGDFVMVVARDLRSQKATSPLVSCET